MIADGVQGIGQVISDQADLVKVEDELTTIVNYEGAK